jgi:hypothetical protein
MGLALEGKRADSVKKPRDILIYVEWKRGGGGGGGGGGGAGEEMMERGTTGGRARPAWSWLPLSLVLHVPVGCVDVGGVL